MELLWGTPGDPLPSSQSNRFVSPQLVQELLCLLIQWHKGYKSFLIKKKSFLGINTSKPESKFRGMRARKMLKLVSMCNSERNRGFSAGSVVKMEAWVRSLGREDPLEEGMAIHSRILAWKTPWAEEPGGLQSLGLQRVRHDWSHQPRMHILERIQPYIYFLVPRPMHFGCRNNISNYGSLSQSYKTVPQTHKVSSPSWLCSRIFIRPFYHFIKSSIYGW